MALYTMMRSIWIQIVTNFLNDAIDSCKGDDTEERLGLARVTA